MTEHREEMVASTAAAAGGEIKKAPASFRVILGEKVGMTQVFHEKTGHLYGVTVVKAGPCPVMRVKTSDGRDGYNAVQLAFGALKESRVSSPEAGQFKAAGIAPTRWVREIRVEKTDGLEKGQTVSLDGLFKPGDYVDVQGTSKGKGFAGVMKRYNFRGLPASHGASDKQRSPGSLASRRSLGRVLPGQRMAGRMGSETVTVSKVQVLRVEADRNLIYLCGAAPGPRGGLITITETVKTKKSWIEPTKLLVKKDKMGNIIKAPPVKGGKK